MIQDIHDFIRKLRRTADLVEGIWLPTDPAAAPKAARAIEKRVTQAFTASPALPAAAPVVDTRKRKYAPGTHWTQRPENKAKLAKLGRARGRRRMQKAQPTTPK